MADTSTVARPYAKALFDLASAERALPRWSAALAAAAAVVGDANAKRVLANPSLTDAQRAELVASVASGVAGGEALGTPHGRNLLKLLAENDRLGALPDIAAQFDALKAQAENKVKVTLVSATAVDVGAGGAGHEGAHAAPRSRGGADARGRRLAARRRDHSCGRHGHRRLGAHAFAAAHRIAGRLITQGQHMAIKASEISELIRQRIQNFEAKAEARDVGTIIALTDGICRIHGLADVQYGEMIEFPGNTYGLALNLEQDSVGAVVLGDYKHISEGDTVKTTGRILEVPVGEALLGRVVDALGQPIDGKGPIATTLTSPIEKVAPGVIDRQCVSQPVQTGLKSIDSMVPIGRGQRELIIGDRQTGKTRGRDRRDHQPEGRRP